MSSLPSEMLIDKLLNNSLTTLSSLRDTFAYTTSTSVPSSAQEKVSAIPALDKLRECNIQVVTLDLLTRHISAFDDCIFSAASHNTQVSSCF